ncbi:MAG: hypothetical protein WBL63_21195 [Candidatus Acidiferrum sp.]
METRHPIPIAPGRIFGAWVCLVAMVLLWAPIWAAAWQADAMTCCNGGLCPAHGHSKTNHPSSQQKSPSNSPMDCDYHDGGVVSRCSMSCSHDGNPLLTTAVIFVLPTPTYLSQPSQAIAALIQFTPTEFVQSFEPLSPPPRLSLFPL